MHRLVRTMTAALTGAALVTALGAGAVAAHGRHDGAVVGHVYVNENTAGHNSIAGFDRHADGSLTPMAGSPFDAGGAGTGAPFGSAGGLQETADGRYLLATDPGSDEISVLRILPGGTAAARGRRVVRRPHAGQHRRPRRPGVRRQHRRRRQQLHRVPPQRRRPPADRSRDRPCRCPTTRCRATSSSAPTAPASSRPGSGRMPGRPSSTASESALTARSTPPQARRSRRSASARSAARSRRPTTIACSCPTPTTAPGAGSVSVYDVAANGGLTRDLRVAVRRQPDGPLLGRDQPRRTRAVRRQHRRARRSRATRSPGTASSRSPAPRRSRSPTASGPSTRRSRPTGTTCTWSTPAPLRSARSRSTGRPSRSCAGSPVSIPGGAPFGIVVD